ncbi:MAG: hypothetical protein CUN49_13305 [Candidatus Thermofonsia Clade 1 bacterium]|jgi:peroxiredoxin|uniref:Alkyl hydroperoxide reductase subunit C/ Thiol specific antioxidant domain-containing protein n=1 Tax=Candidatus Thermofonsia Clade 1 bacterium TaxID=2364210 RepID=A0A2M8PBG8_9CHLR|nr:MAG: hypothetical protein CUN49_13305 [Candidatus Thermofonsia Clade 1 bacterium]RMF49700.1 MAG: hypothetical protein D6749_12455 [Chloroflexota bacterium]
MRYENKPSALPEPLPYGRVAPDFRLQSLSGAFYSREQFRGKQALVLLFLQQAENTAIALLRELAQLWPEFIEINANILAIFDSTAALSADLRDLPFPLLADSENRAWLSYTHQPTRGAALFVLDTYGAPSAQRLVPSAADLPSAEDILDRVRYTQYRCSA